MPKEEFLTKAAKDSNFMKFLSGFTDLCSGTLFSVTYTNTVETFSGLMLIRQYGDTDMWYVTGYDKKDVKKRLHEFFPLTVEAGQIVVHGRSPIKPVVQHEHWNWPGDQKTVPKFPDYIRTHAVLHEQSSAWLCWLSVVELCEFVQQQNVAAHTVVT